MLKKHINMIERAEYLKTKGYELREVGSCELKKELKENFEMKMFF